jgi:hypothetical protein
VSNALFLFRLIPPRADFAHTMTDTEQDAMARPLAIGAADPSVLAGVNTFEVAEIMGGTTG